MPKIVYEGEEYVYDLSIDFCMKSFCYANGCNCYTCAEECNFPEVLMMLSNIDC